MLNKELALYRYFDYFPEIGRKEQGLYEIHQKCLGFFLESDNDYEAGIMLQYAKTIRGLIRLLQAAAVNPNFWRAYIRSYCEQLFGFEQLIMLIRGSDEFHDFYFNNNISRGFVNYEIWKYTHEDTFLY